ncbi:hypothetical protein FQZ97_308310 [compost metagenome]
MLRPRFGLGGGDYHADAHEQLHRLRSAAGGQCCGAHLVHLGAGGGLVVAADEHAFGVLAGKTQAPRGGAGLEQHRRALWRRLAEVVALDVEELAVVADLVHLFRLGVDAPLAVGDHRALLPAALPELVEHLQVLVGLVVAAVVLHLLRQAHGAGGAFQVAGDDVPAHPAFAEVVQGRHAPGEQIRRVVAQVGGEAEAQVPRRPGHGGDQQQRVVHRQLDALLQGQVDVALVDVVDAHYVRQEQPVEQTALQQSGQVGPVGELAVVGRTVARVGPEPVVDMPHAIHVEGVEEDLLARHQIVPRRGGNWPLR